MARIGLDRRVADLEAEAGGRFTGYATVLVQPGQTLANAQADWLAENGPLDGRQWVVFNAGGINAAA